ncbi:hypothetical protein V3N99_17115 [Dermatophilaceae bacterium Soc4.6]
MRASSHDVGQVLRRFGDCATWRQLRTVTEHQRVAHLTSGTLSHLSAAVAHGWAVKTEPHRPWVTYQRTRHLNAADATAVHPSWRNLPAADRERAIISEIPELHRAAARHLGLRPVGQGRPRRPPPAARSRGRGLRGPTAHAGTCAVTPVATPG